MRGALLIAKKEFLELSKDRKTMFFAFVLPFLLYPAIFGMMAKMGKRDEAQNRNKASRVYVADPSGVLNGLLADTKLFERVAKPEGDLRPSGTRSWRWPWKPIPVPRRPCRSTRPSPSRPPWTKASGLRKWPSSA